MPLLLLAPLLPAPPPPGAPGRCETGRPANCVSPPPTLHTHCTHTHVGILSSFFFKYADSILKKQSSTIATILTGAQPGRLRKPHARVLRQRGIELLRPSGCMFAWAFGHGSTSVVALGPQYLPPSGCPVCLCCQHSGTLCCACSPMRASLNPRRIPHPCRPPERSGIWSCPDTEFCDWRFNCVHFHVSRDRGGVGRLECWGVLTSAGGDLSCRTWCVAHNSARPALPPCQPCQAPCVPDLPASAPSPSFLAAMQAHLLLHG